jgi:Uma2 family endonuclease
MGLTERLVADGVTRWKFTGEEVLAMSEAGILGDRSHVEVIEGELIEMAPEGTPHDITRNLLIEEALERAILAHGKSRPFALLSTPTAWLADGGFTEPDIAVVAAVVKGQRFRVADLLLVIEISNTSLKYDLDVKSKLYASENVPEYWVIDLKSRELVIHTLPGTEGYGNLTILAGTGTVHAKSLPAFAINIDNIL